MRRSLLAEYGESKLYAGGLSVRTTLDPKLQQMGRKALIDGLVTFDRAAGLARPGGQDRRLRRLGRAARRHRQSADIAPWRLGVVLSADKAKAVVGLEAGAPAGRQAHARNVMPSS